MPDLLAQFRRPGSLPAVPIEDEPPQAVSPVLPVGGYQAFTVCSGAVKPARLEIRPKEGLAIVRPYSALSEIAYDRTDYSGIMLLFGTKIVKIDGRHLQPVVEALIAGTCEVLTEHESGQVVPLNAPVIDKIILRNDVAKPAAKPEAAPSGRAAK